MPIKTTRRRRLASRKKRAPSLDSSPVEGRSAMKNLSMILAAGLLLAFSTSRAWAEDQPPQPVVVQVSTAEPADVPLPSNAWDAAPCIVETPCEPQGAPCTALIEGGHGHNDSCRSWLHWPSCLCCTGCVCQWLSYKPLPVPCECQCHCCCCGSQGGCCTPHLYAFFWRGGCSGAGCCTPGGGDTCQSGCGCGSH
jgi:hypothetical protein